MPTASSAPKPKAREPMPRIDTLLLPKLSFPPTKRLGTCMGSLVRSVILLSCRSAWLKAVIAIGVVWTVVSLRVAVTLISSSSVVLEELALEVEELDGAWPSAHAGMAPMISRQADAVRILLRVTVGHNMMHIPNALQIFCIFGPNHHA